MSLPTPSSPFTPDDLRAALGQFATGVTIVTARDAQGGLVGLTANSFNSVSLSPPLILWSLGIHAGTLPGFRTATHYAINVLAADQRVLAERFCRRGIDRFEGTPWSPGITGAPIIEGASAVFECSQYSQHEAGDHIVFVGKVEHCSRRVGVAPLLFHGGRFFTELAG